MKKYQKHVNTPISLENYTHYTYKYLFTVTHFETIHSNFEAQKQ